MVDVVSQQPTGGPTAQVRRLHPKIGIRLALFCIHRVNGEPGEILSELNDLIIIIVIIKSVTYLFYLLLRYACAERTESKIEAQTSAATQRTKIGSDVTLWCNATGYPKPVVYWTREDRNRRLPDGTYQFWVGYSTMLLIN